MIDRDEGEDDHHSHSKVIIESSDELFNPVDDGQGKNPRQDDSNLREIHG